MIGSMTVKSCNDLSKVNDVFTKNTYAGKMFERAFSAAKTLSAWASLALALFVFQPSTAFAQSEDIDWGDANQPSQGTFPSGTTVTGSDGTTATVTRVIATDGGTFTPAFFATDFLSYFSGQIGAGTRPLLLNFDNSSFDPDDTVTYDIVLSRAVTNFNFTLSDVDNGGGTDAIEVFYDDDLTGGFTNAAGNNALWVGGPSVTRTNNAVINGWRGTGASGQTTTDGDIAFDFNTVQVRRIRVVFRSYTGTGDPGAQFVGLSTLRYDEATIAPGADLSLTKSLVGSPPVQGGVATWRLRVTNNEISTQGATGVIVRETFPAAFTLGSFSGDGTFNTGNGNWTVPDLLPGQSASITFTGTISATAGTTVTNTAQIIASNQPDFDSTVNNGVTTEDDYATNSFVVQTGRAPGTPPVLSCPVGQSVFDWDNVTNWGNGDTSNTSAFAGFGDVNFTLTNNGVYVNNALWGGNVPNLGTYFNGGLNPAEDVLQIVSDQANQSGEVVLTIALPRSFTGLQFSVFDVDFGANQFADRLIVTGSNNGTTFNPTLTNGNVNFVSGNTVIGDGVADNNASTGNVVVTFTQEIDTVVIRYGNANTAPANPGQQGIGVHDLFFCTPDVDLTVSKVSSIIADPVNGTTNPKAIPGATVEYLITVTNTGIDAAFEDTVRVLDNGPADARMCLISRAGGPIIFNDPGGNSNLTYAFASLGSGADDVEFSNNNGASFAYTPVDDGTGCDANITDFRVNPGGAFAAGATFTITVRYEIE
ncbi:proprotein convertase, P [Erythrobacter longus]|uniref:Proprotein convertase, P n=1 Tax=Erythrobacter longus TaxID=1044 RepID=A0A074MZV9_ERYLO|nr:proprotein convertase, P [Erythrobacter longus]